MKLVKCFHADRSLWSPPARGRGLKQKCVKNNMTGQTVAPRAGAWIETYKGITVVQTGMSPPARGRGLKRCRG